MHHPAVLVLSLLGSLAFALPSSLAGCAKSSSSSSEAVEQPPEPPPMPSGWTIEQNHVIPPDQFPAVESKLKGKLKALRNTIYKANGHRVQLNILVPTSPTEADKMFRVLANMKPQWALVRKGDVIYEFVGNDDAADEIKKAQRALQR